MDLGADETEGTLTMGCGCGGKGGASATIEYEVKLKSGAVQTVATKQEARIVIAAAGVGGTYKAVPKK